MAFGIIAEVKHHIGSYIGDDEVTHSRATAIIAAQDVIKLAIENGLVDPFSIASLTSCLHM